MTFIQHHDGSVLPSDAQFHVAPDPAIGTLRSAATNASGRGLELVAGSTARVATWTLLGAVVGAALGFGAVLLVVSILPSTMNPFYENTGLAIAVASAVGGVALGALAFLIRKAIDRGAYEVSYVGTDGIQQVVRSRSTVVRFADVSKLDMQRTGLAQRGVNINVQDTDSMWWYLKNGRTTVIHCEYQPVLARSKGLDHDRLAFANAAQQAWTQFAATGR